MRKRKRITIGLLTIFLAVIAVMFSGCGYAGYKGKYSGACTLAYTSVPDTRGAWFYGPNFADSSIVLLETDTQGRGLYLYLESTEGPLSALIVQKEDKSKVYYYPEDCFLCFKTPDNGYDLAQKKPSKEKIIALFQELCSAEKLQQFKQVNDWDLDLQETKCDSANIKKQSLSVIKNYRVGKVKLSKSTWEKHMEAVAIKNGHNLANHFEMNDSLYSEANWMATDEYGRELYYIEGYYYTYGDKTTPYLRYIKTHLEMVAIVNPDKTFNAQTFMVELTDKYNCQEQLKALKVANNWNKPLSMSNGNGEMV